MPTSRWIALSSTCICSRSLRSRAPSGSSSSSTLGRLTSARASATRWRWPPESWPGRRSSEALQPHRRQRLARPARRRAALPTLLTISPYSTLSTHRHVREQRVVLEDRVDVAVERRAPGDVAAAERRSGRRSASRSRRSSAARSSCPSRTGRASRRTRRRRLEVDRSTATTRRAGPEDLPEPGEPHRRRGAGRGLAGLAHAHLLDPAVARTLAKDHRSGPRIPSRSRQFVSETVVRPRKCRLCTRPRHPGLRRALGHRGPRAPSRAEGGVCPGFCPWRLEVAGPTMRPVRLLERDSPLASLREYAEDARQGAGRLVLVAGEAGVGKTALLESLEEELPLADWAWGGCDGLSTPRPLGPAVRHRGSRRRRPAGGLPGGGPARDALPHPAAPGRRDRATDGAGDRGRALGGRGHPRPGALPRAADPGQPRAARRDLPGRRAATRRPAAGGAGRGGQPPRPPGGSAWRRCPSRRSGSSRAGAGSRRSCSSSSPAATRSTSLSCCVAARLTRAPRCPARRTTP